MIHCVSESCRKEIDDSWSFCAYCGADNRPPENRHKVANCPHEFIDHQGFCIQCGLSRDEYQARVNSGESKGYMYNDYSGVDTFDGPRGHGEGIIGDGCVGCAGSGVGSVLFLVSVLIVCIRHL